MNTDLIYVANIPSNIKPVLLLHELQNKWARMLYLENTCSGQRDAFVYNPHSTFEHFQDGVKRLRNKVIDATQPLSVYYVWFPPRNMVLTTMIPKDSSMLPYIFVENLPKGIVPMEVIYDLPLQHSDVKTWDIPERTDKCLIIKMPPNCPNGLRSFLLASLRSRIFQGSYARVSELIISEDCVLNAQLIPRVLRIPEVEDSYLSNYFYIHEVPPKVTVKMLIQKAKEENIKGCRVFFMETFNNMKYGFMYLPKSLPHDRFMTFFEILRKYEFKLQGGEIGRIKIDEVWFQPEKAKIPMKKDSDGEMMLTEYLYLSGIPAGIIPQHLAVGCPVPVKLNIFPVNEMSTQVGFIVLRGLNEFDAKSVIEHFRSLDLGGTPMKVDEVYLWFKESPVIRPFQLIARLVTEKTRKRAANNGDDDIQIMTIPDDEYSLMKTEFLCIDNLPKNIGKAALLFDIGRASDGCIMIPLKDSAMAFIYFPDCGSEEWKNIIRKLIRKNYMGKKPIVYEVYLQTGDLTYANLTKELVDCQMIFAYNISDTVTVDDIYALNRSHIIFAELLETTSGSKSAFISFSDTLSESDYQRAIGQIRRSYLKGKPVYADSIKLANVKPNVNEEIDYVKKKIHFMNSYTNSYNCKF